MFQLLDNDKIGLFLAFAVPGIILLYFRTRFLTGRMPAGSDGLLAYVTLSLLYHGAGFVVLGSKFQSLLLEPSRLWLLLYIFVVPAILGTSSGLGAKKGWSAIFLKKFGFDVVHPVDSAWDWYFSNCKNCWVIVKLKDGTRWAGVLGEKSFISSDRSERDIYLERVYTIGKKDVWIENTSSVLIAHAEIQSIEMWPKGA